MYVCKREGGREGGRKREGGERDRGLPNASSVRYKRAEKVFSEYVSTSCVVR